MDMKAGSSGEQIRKAHLEFRQFELLNMEFEALLEAVRRDLRVQNALALAVDEDDAAPYRLLARRDIRLLEALNPKHSRPTVVAGIRQVAYAEGVTLMTHIEIRCRENKVEVKKE